MTSVERILLKRVQAEGEGQSGVGRKKGPFYPSRKAELCSRKIAGSLLSKGRKPSAFDGP